MGRHYRAHSRAIHELTQELDVNSLASDNTTVIVERITRIIDSIIEIVVGDTVMLVLRKQAAYDINR